MSDTQFRVESDAQAASPTGDAAVQGPLDREALAAHFQGYELERLITVVLRPVELVTPPAGRTGEGGRA